MQMTSIFSKHMGGLLRLLFGGLLRLGGVGGVGVGSRDKNVLCFTDYSIG